MKEIDKTTYINYRIEKAQETFNDAKLLFQNKRWNACINRLYYSCFYVVIALLLENNINAKSHQGVKRQFGNNFILTNKVEKKYGKLYSQLFDWRTKGDSGDLFDFAEKDITPLIEPVENFINVITILIKSEI